MHKAVSTSGRQARMEPLRGRGGLALAIRFNLTATTLHVVAEAT